MPKNSWNDYSATAASNTDVGGVNIDEGMSPSDVNNAMREILSHTADVVAGTVALSSINIDGGSITGITDLAVADGGTGSSTAAGARTNLGLVIGTDVQAFDADNLTADVSDNLTAGYSSDFEAIGNSGTGTQTLEISSTKENLKTLTINGSFTLAPQTVNSVIALIATNDGTGGYTITTSGYDLVSGTYNNAASAKHLFRSTVIDGTQVLEILEIA
ncbi:MAG: hypothetical protein VW443_07950 [Pseudomonadales bacterium]